VADHGSYNVTTYIEKRKEKKQRKERKRTKEKEKYYKEIIPEKQVIPPWKKNAPGLTQGKQQSG